MKYAIGLMFALLGCGGAAMLVKPPLVQRCQGAGLKGCDDLADGAIDYINGEKDKARGKIIDGAIKNEPAKVKAFTKILRNMDDVPGMHDYTGPLLEVADMMESVGPQAPAASVAAGSQAAPAKAPGGRSAELERVQTSMAFPLRGEAERCDGALAEQGFCVLAGVGPLIITDIAPSAGCAGDVVAASSELGFRQGQPRWFVDVGSGLHGVKLAVPRGDKLRIGVNTPHGAKGPRADTGCAVAWSGIALEP